MSWPVTLAIAGTGNRGRTYAGYAERFPDRVRLVVRVEQDVLVDVVGGGKNGPSSYEVGEEGFADREPPEEQKTDGNPPIQGNQRRDHADTRLWPRTSRGDSTVIVIP